MFNNTAPIDGGWVFWIRRHQRQRSSIHPKPAATTAACCPPLESKRSNNMATTCLHLAVSVSEGVTTLTVLPCAALPCRVQGSIVATAPCLFIPAAAAAILGLQRKGLSRAKSTIPQTLPVSFFKPHHRTIPLFHSVYSAKIQFNLLYVTFYCILVWYLLCHRWN